MKKLITGLAWQAMGLLGAIMCICEAAQHNWDYLGITGTLGSLMGTGLILPVLVCVAMFIAGSVFVIREIWEK